MAQNHTGNDHTSQDNTSQGDNGQNDSGTTPDQDMQARSAAVPAPDHQTLQAANILDGADDQSVGAELLHAALALPPDAIAPDVIAHVELTLDQLGNTVDLFDVPPFDYGDDAI